MMIDPKILEMLNATEDDFKPKEKAEPQNNQTDTETRLTELEQAFDALLNGVTE